jgi:hypothetical protein
MAVNARNLRMTARIYRPQPECCRSSVDLHPRRTSSVPSRIAIKRAAGYPGQTVPSDQDRHAKKGAGYAPEEYGKEHDEKGDGNRSARDAGFLRRRLKEKS